MRDENRFRKLFRFWELENEQAMKLVFAKSDYAENIRVIQNIKKNCGKNSVYFNSTPESIPDFVKAYHKSRSKQDVHFSINSYKGNVDEMWRDKRLDRRTSLLFSLRLLVIDIDCHEKKVKNDVMKLEMFKNFLFDRMECEKNRIVQPSIIHFTGRGVQIMYVLEEASVKTKKYYNVLLKELQDRYIKLLSTLPYMREYSVDCAACGYNGLARMFGTYNTAAEAYTQAFVIHERKLSLDCLRTALQIPEWKKKVKTKKKKIVTKKEQLSRKNAAMKARRIVLTRRERVLWKLPSKQVITEGNRELTLFHLYNVEKQLHGEILAKELVREYNQKRCMPTLPEKEVEAIFSGFQKVSSRKGNGHFYAYTDEKFIAENQLSKEECLLYGFPAETGRNVLRNRENHCKKVRRNNRILMMYQCGKKLSEIAAEAECCLKTVKTVLNRVIALTEREKQNAACDRKHLPEKGGIPLGYDILAPDETEEPEDRMVFLHLTGKTTSEIATALKCSLERVEDVLLRRIPDWEVELPF